MPDLTFSLLDAALWGKLFEIIALNIVLLVLDGVIKSV